MTVSQVARAAGVVPDTVRYYEKRGLLAPPARSAAGYRHYGAADVARLRLIKRAQSLGFTLREIGELLDGGTGGIADRARRKITSLEQQRAQLAEAIRRLRLLAAACDGDRPGCASLEVEETP